MPKSKGSIAIIGRRWFERTNGNTYHSAEVYFNGKNIGREPFAYGYGSQYEQTAMEILCKNIPKIKKLVAKQGYMMPWHLKDFGYTVVSSVSDVTRKKDL